MYEEENRNLSENPTPEHGAGTDAVNTEHTESSAVENGAESNVTESNVTENNAAESTDTESSSTGSQYRYTGPFYEDTDYQRTERRRESTAHAETGNASCGKKKKKGFGRTIAKTVCIALIFGVVAGAAFQGTNFVGQKLFGDKVRPTAAPVRRTTPLPYPPL